MLQLSRFKILLSFKRIKFLAFSLLLAIAPFNQGCAKEIALTIPKPSTTYNLAQTVEWINSESFSVGRWDGSITVFRKPQKQDEYGPVILQALITPSAKGVEMLYRMNDQTLVSSNDLESVAIWDINNNGVLSLNQTLSFEGKLGTANSATSISVEDKTFLIVGHSNGFVSIWSLDAKNFHSEKIADVRTPDKPANPFNLYNIRAVLPYGNNRVITASEDGDLTLLQIPEGKVLARKRFNPAAQRGINSISFDGVYLLLGNCSVGRTDKNLWLYTIQNDSFELVDSANLAKNKELDQVFNFDVELFNQGDHRFFFSSTGEGLLWLGEIKSSKLHILDKVEVSQSGGAALDIGIDFGNLAAISQAINLFPMLFEKK